MSDCFCSNKNTFVTRFIQISFKCWFNLVGFMVHQNDTGQIAMKICFFGSMLMSTFKYGRSYTECIKNTFTYCHLNLKLSLKVIKYRYK